MAMSEKEFLDKFINWLAELKGNNTVFESMRGQMVAIGSTYAFLEEHHKTYYEVEFEPKTSVQIHAPSILMSMPIVVDESLPDNIIELRNGGIVVDRIRIDIDK